MFHCWVRVNSLYRDDLKLSGIFYVSLITNVSVATCNTQWFVWLERIAAKRHRQDRALPLPWCLRLIDYIFDCLRCHSTHTYNVRQFSTSKNEVQLNESKSIMQHGNEHTSASIYPFMDSTNLLAVQDFSPNALQPLMVNTPPATIPQSELDKLTAQVG